MTAVTTLPPPRLAALLATAERRGLLVRETPADERPAGSDGRSWTVQADPAARYVGHVLWINWYPGASGGRSYFTLWSTHKRKSKRITRRSACTWLHVL